MKRTLVVDFPVYRVSAGGGGGQVMQPRSRTYWSLSKDEGIGPGMDEGPSTMFGRVDWVVQEGLLWYKTNLQDNIQVQDQKVG